MTPSVSPLFSPSGLIYRYVLQSPDRSPMELKTIDDWIVERQYKSVPGVADDSGLGGETMQYQVLLDPVKIAAVGLSVPQVESALAANNGNAGGGFYSQGGQFYYVRGLGRLDTLEDIGNVVLAVHNGTPILVKDVGRVVIGHRAAPGPVWLPGSGRRRRRRHLDAHRGTNAERPETGRGEDQGTQRAGPAKGRQNPSVLRPQRFDRADDRRPSSGTCCAACCWSSWSSSSFLYDFRAGLIVATAIPLALLFAFICLDLQDVSANLLSIGAVDFGILVDGAVVMVENIFRQVAARRGESFNIREIIAAAAAEVDRPIFYAVAVIVAGFLPIYVLSGPSGKIVQADGRHDDFCAGRLLDCHADPAAGALFLGHAEGRARAAQCRL